MKLELPRVNPRHRGDIQTLRAVAVLLVIFYHLKIIKGGFLGVDIFFVISGYVITQNLASSQGTLGKKLKEFYLRRAKRILPSSLFVILVVALLSRFFLAPIYQHRFRVDALWSSLMGANIGFGLHNLDYLQATVSPSPYLHYWSLGVEEQFYIIWPLLFFAYFALRRNRIIWLIPISIAIALISTNIWPVFSFYLPSSRAFQFLFGAALVGINQAKKLNKSLALAGWIGIFASAFLISDSIANPNIYSLIPTLATASVIYADSKMFTFKVFQFIGEISFALYLVHWPVILFFGKGSQELQGVKIWLALLVMAVATLLLSVLIEIPFRYERLGKIPALGWVVILALSTLAVQGIYSIPHTNKGGGVRFDLSKPAIYSNGCHLNQSESAIKESCAWGSTGPKVLLVGDSHAAQWFPAFFKLATENKISLFSATKSSCPITSNIIYVAGKANISCQKWQENLLNFVKAKNFDLIVFSAFDHNNYDVRGANWAGGVSKFIDLIYAKNKVIQLIDTPKPYGDSVACLSSNAKNLKACEFPIQKVIKIENLKVKYIDPTPWLCPNKCVAVLNGVNTYRDGSHISVSAAEFLAPQIERALLSN